MDFIHQFDYWFFATLNNFAGRWPWFDAVVKLFMNDYFVPTLMAITLLALWFEGISPAQRSLHQRAVLVASLSALLTNVILKVINLFYFRPRPFVTYSVNLLFYQPTDPSLPSNAAAFGFSIAVGVWFYQRRWGNMLLILALIFGLSRVFGGVHYPLDILSGAGLGCLAACFIHRWPHSIDRLLHVVTSLTTRLGLP